MNPIERSTTEQTGRIVGIDELKLASSNGKLIVKVELFARDEVIWVKCYDRFKRHVYAALASNEIMENLGIDEQGGIQKIQYWEAKLLKRCRKSRQMKRWHLIQQVENQEW